MATLNPSALRRVANWCITCGVFRGKNAGDSDHFYGEKPADLTGLEPVSLNLHADVAQDDRAKPKDLEENALEGGDSPRVMVDTIDLHKDKEVIPPKNDFRTQEKSISFRRLVASGLFRGRRHSGKVATSPKEFGKVEIDEAAEKLLANDTTSSKGTTAGTATDSDEIVLEFGQMLLDLSVEDFLKIKPKHPFNIPFIVVTPPPEEGSAPFVV